MGDFKREYEHYVRIMQSRNKRLKKLGWGSLCFKIMSFKTFVEAKND